MPGQDRSAVGQQDIRPHSRAHSGLLLDALHLDLEALVLLDQLLDVLPDANQVLLGLRARNLGFRLRQAEQLGYVHRQPHGVAVEHLVQSILARGALVLLFQEPLEVGLQGLRARKLRGQAACEARNTEGESNGAVGDHRSIPR
jgi:hypothetical protein